MHLLADHAAQLGVHLPREVVLPVRLEPVQQVSQIAPARAQRRRLVGAPALTRLRCGELALPRFQRRKNATDLALPHARAALRRQAAAQAAREPCDDEPHGCWQSLLATRPAKT